MNREEFYSLSGWKDPFLIPRRVLPYKMFGWHGNSPYITNLVKQQKPKIILEVGTFLGMSAINMASVLYDDLTKPLVFCVDTWLGSIEHIYVNDRNQTLEYFNYFQGGTSNLYDQFLSNVIYSGTANNIIPIPATSTTGFQLFKFLGIKPNLIYVDAAHDTNSVLFDLKGAKEILNENGIIFGDDIAWKTVRDALTIFGCKYSESNPFWMIKYEDIYN